MQELENLENLVINNSFLKTLELNKSNKLKTIEIINNNVLGTIRNLTDLHKIVTMFRILGNLLNKYKLVIMIILFLKYF